MTAYTGTIIQSTQWTDRGKLQVFRGKGSWTEALASGDTFTIADFNKDQTPILPIYFKLFGNVGDVHATPTLAVKAGVTGDDDALLVSTIFDAAVVGRQVRLDGNGAALSSSGQTITGKDLIVTLTANPATSTGVTTGTWFFEVGALGQQ